MRRQGRGGCRGNSRAGQDRPGGQAMSDQRFYSLLNIKSFDDDARTIRGIATTPATDRVADIVEPDGARFALPLPFPRGHDSQQPTGHVTEAKRTKDGNDIAAYAQRSD